MTSINLSFLKAGTPSPTGFVMNLQPSEVEAGFDIRIPPTADFDELERRIREEWAPEARNMTFEFKQKVRTFRRLCGHQLAHSLIQLGKRCSQWKKTSALGSGRQNGAARVC